MKGLCLVLVLTFAASAKAVELTVITPKGSVSFTADDEWTAGMAQTKLPVAAIGFQVEDPVDRGTADSTNVIVSLYDQTSPAGKDGLKTIGKQYGPVPPAASRVGDWQVFEQRGAQGATEYTILDARRDVADVVVGVRLAWPHLKGQPKNHEATMRELFSNLLASIHGELGRRRLKPGELIRRPTRTKPAPRH